MLIGMDIIMIRMGKISNDYIDARVDVLNSIGRRKKEDECVWKDIKTQIYMVKSAYRKLQNGIMGEEANLYKNFLKITAQHFAWKVIFNILCETI